MPKNRTTITVLGREYNIVSEDSPEYIHRVAFHVEDRMRKLSKEYLSLNTNMLQVLALLNLADENLKAKDALFEVQKQLRLLQDALEKLQREGEVRAAENAKLQDLHAEQQREIAQLQLQMRMQKMQEDAF